MIQRYIQKVFRSDLAPHFLSCLPLGTLSSMSVDSALVLSFTRLSACLSPAEHMRGGTRSILQALKSNLLLTIEMDDGKYAGGHEKREEKHHIRSCTTVCCSILYCCLSFKLCFCVACFCIRTDLAMTGSAYVNYISSMNRGSIPPPYTCDGLCRHVSMSSSFKRNIFFFPSTGIKYYLTRKRAARVYVCV